MRWFARQYIGTRSSQQDSIRVSRTAGGLLAAVCDGMGSKPDSGEASQLAAELVTGMYEREAPGDMAEFLKRAVTEADEEVADRFDGSGGTTGVFAHIGIGGLSWFSVGDSRLYLFRGGLTQLTRDHNYRYLLERRLAENVITREQYEEGLSRGGMLVSFIGMDGLFLADMSARPLPLLQSDMVLITTDGLYRALGEEYISAVLAGYSARGDTEGAADALMNAVSAIKDRAVDNSSFVLADML